MPTLPIFVVKLGERVSALNRQKMFYLVRLKKHCIAPLFCLISLIAAKSGTIVGPETEATRESKRAPS